jgi:hypothetical protein
MPANDDFYYVGGDFLREVLRIMRKVEGFTLRGNVDFTNSPTGISGFVKGPGEGGEGDPTPSLRLFHITGERGAGGMYIMVQVTSDGTGISSATPESLGTDSDTEVTGLNLQEVNSDTHWLTAADNVNQLWCLGLPWGTDSEGRPLFLICHVWVDPCEPATGPTGPTGPAGHSITVTEGSSPPGSPAVGDIWIQD